MAGRPIRAAALVLAAGSARRFGADKLSAPLAGISLVHHAIRIARAAPVERVILVAHPGLVVGEWPGAPIVEVVRVNSQSLSQSLSAGLAALPAETDQAFVFLGDMPRVPPEMAGRLAEALDTNYAALPRHSGLPGHPVLLSAQALADAARLTGDAGFAPLLRGRSDVVHLECDDPGVRLDVDRPDDLAAIA